MSPRNRALLSWFVAFAVLLAAETGVRAVRSTTTLPYTPGVRAYRALGPELRELGAAPVSIVGSSRAREGLLVPRLAERWGLAPGPAGVANYSLAGAHAADVEIVVRRMLESDRPPKLILYGMSPRQLATMEDGGRLTYRMPFLWLLSDWWEARTRIGDDADRLLPAAMKNELARHSSLFSMRPEIVDAVTDAKRPTSAFPSAVKRLFSPVSVSAHPMRGTMPPWQQGRGRNRSRKLKPAAVKKYLGNRHRDEEWPNTWQLEHVRSLLRHARRAGVAVLLVEVPIHPVLDRHMPPGTTDSFRAAMVTLAAEEGTRFIAFESLGVEIPAKGFREQSHLNLRGATLYSDAVADVLKEDVARAVR